MLKAPQQKWLIGLHTQQCSVTQGQRKFAPRLLPRGTVDDHFGQHRIVERRHGQTFSQPVIDPRKIAGPPAQHIASLRHKAPGNIFGNQSCLDRVSRELHLFLRHRKVLARRNVQLPADQVKTRHGFSDRMFDLQAGVHFHEIKLTVRCQQALDRTRPHIVDRTRGAHRHLTKRLAQERIDRRARRLLDQLLVPALQRAIAFAQMDDVTVRVSKDLYFHMTRLLHGAFENQFSGAKRRQRLGACAF